MCLHATYLLVKISGSDIKVPPSEEQIGSYFDFDVFMAQYISQRSPRSMKERPTTQISGLRTTEAFHTPDVLSSLGSNTKLELDFKDGSPRCRLLSVAKLSARKLELVDILHTGLGCYRWPSPPRQGQLGSSTVIVIGGVRARQYSTRSK